MVKRRGRPRKTGEREASGRIKRDFKAEREIDAQENNLRARCIAMNIPATKENMIAMRHPMAGCTAGHAIMQHTADHEARAALFGAVTHMRRVQAAYEHAIGAPSRYPASANLLIPPEPFEVDASTTIDLRTEDDRYRDAISAYMRLHTWLGYTDSAAASECKRVCLDGNQVKDSIGFLSALSCIRDGLDGSKPKWRGRA